MVGGVSAFLSQIANIAKMSTKDLEEAGLRRLFIASEMSVWRQPFLCTSGSYGTKHVGFRVGVWPTYKLFYRDMLQNLMSRSCHANVALLSFFVKSNPRNPVAVPPHGIHFFAVMLPWLPWVAVVKKPHEY